MGPTVVRRLAAAGAKLALAGRVAGTLDALAEEAEVDADTTSVDLLDADAARVGRRGRRPLGRVDALFHSRRGLARRKPIEESPREDWDFLSSLLIDTLQNVTQAFVPHLLASGRGRFAIVGAGQAQSPTNTNAAYAAAKAAAEADARARRPLPGNGRDGEHRRHRLDRVARDARRGARQGLLHVHAGGVDRRCAHLCSDAAAPMNGQRLTLRGAVARASETLAPELEERERQEAGEGEPEEERRRSGGQADPEHRELGREASVCEERE